MPKIMITVGEASGDLHGANVANALKLLNPNVKLVGMGGEAMQKAGVEIIYDIKDLGVIGVVEVVKNLPRLFKLRDDLLAYMEKERPDVLVVIDYPEFNMRLAKKAKALGIKIVSYISPSAWAWRKGRAKDVAKIVDRLAAIFPFERDVYVEAGANVTFVGHPLMDIVKPALTKPEAYAYFKARIDAPIVMLMPGSRKQEITNLLIPMLEATEIIASERPDCQFYLPIASTIDKSEIESIIKPYNVKINLTSGYNYDLMNISTLAIAASGTATLETAIMKMPTIITYRVAAVTYFLGRLLVKIPYIGLPNIVAGKKVLPEFLQADVNAKNISEYALKVLNDDEFRQQIITELELVKEKLGSEGAVKRVAEVILDLAEDKVGGGSCN